MIKLKCSTIFKYIQKRLKHKHFEKEYVIYIVGEQQPIGMRKEIRDPAHRKKDNFIIKKTEGKAVKRVYGTDSNSTRGEYEPISPLKFF